MQFVTNNLCSTQILTRLRRSKRPEFNFFTCTQIFQWSLILASFFSHCRGSLATFWRPTQFKIYGYFHRPKIIFIVTNNKKIENCGRVITLPAEFLFLLKYFSDTLRSRK